MDLHPAIEPESEPPRLKRRIGLAALVFYGTGTMIGGGFYALLGKVVGEAGTATPFALLLTGGLALLSAFAFAELSARFPSSAGPARYVEAGFGRRWLAIGIGYLVVLTGVVSAATLAVATDGFLRDLLLFPPGVGVVLIVLAMGLVAARGIGESVAIVTVITVLEVGALVYVLGLNAPAFADLPARAGELLPGGASEVGILGVFAGAFLAFYAFIGFEDMVTMAEEVKDVRRTLPRAIFLSIAITTVLYVSVAAAAVLSVPLERLVASKTPVAELGRAGGVFAARGLWAVSLLTGINGALVQIIMASRVLYGMAGRGQAPLALGRVHARTRTPLLATGLVILIVLGLALLFPLATLARATSTIMLVIFALVNLALWRVKRTNPNPPEAGPRVPRWLPLAGCLATTSVLAYRIWAMFFQ